MSELDSKFNRVVIDARKFGVEAQAAKRKKALELRDKGNTFVAIAEDLGVHPRTAWLFCKCIRIAQISLGLRGGFWPTSFPLFQASRFGLVSMTNSLVVDRSLIVHLRRPHR